MAAVIFWISAALVVYTYLGYGLLVRLMIAVKRLLGHRRTLSEVSDWPEVTLLICAYNEQDVVADKMLNCRQLDYPEGRLHIVWVTDGSTDGTNDLLAQYPDAQVLYEAPRMGKTAAINRAMPMLQIELVVLTDANTVLCPQAIRHIVREFQDPKVGCVAGEKRIMRRQGDGVTARGEGLYWRYESTLKRWDSELYSAMGAAGELFAIRRSLFQPIDVNMLLDDFILSMKIVGKGYRIAYCAQAYACETGSPSLRDEQTRKVRIAAGGLQSIWQLRALANPLRHPVVAFQLVSHRFLRWSLTPLAVFALVPLNVVLVWMNAGTVYLAAWAAQIVFYALALLGAKVPLYFLFMNVNVLRAVPYLCKKKSGTGAWEKARRSAPAT